MTRNGRWGAAAFALALALLSTAAGAVRDAAAAPVVPARPGQVGIGFQGQYGVLTKSGEMGELFDAGGGYSVRLRYRMRYERAFGLSFERHGFAVRDEQPPDSTFAYQTLSITTASLEFYQMYGTRTPTVKYLSGGVGLFIPTIKLNGGETQLSGAATESGFMFTLGAGLERYVWQSWAVDASVRYHGMIQNSKLNNDIQFQLGVIFYVAY